MVNTLFSRYLKCSEWSLRQFLPQTDSREGRKGMVRGPTAGRASRARARAHTHTPHTHTLHFHRPCSFKFEDLWRTALTHLNFPHCRKVHYSWPQSDRVPEAWGPTLAPPIEASPDSTAAVGQPQPQFQRQGRAIFNLGLGPLLFF